MKKLLDWKIVGIFTVIVSLLIVFSFAKSVQVYLNGQQMTGEHQPFFYKDDVYVSLEPILKEMEVDYEWKDSWKWHIAIEKNGKTYEYQINKSIVLVDGEEVPISIKTVGKSKTKVPSGLKPKKKNNAFFVPVETISQVLGFEVQIESKKGKTIVNIGEKSNIDTHTKTPPTPPKEFDSLKMNTNLIDYYDFIGKKEAGGGLLYNPYTRFDTSVYAILVDYVTVPDGYEFIVTVKGWKNDYIKEYDGVPERVKYILQHVYPTKYNEIYQIIEDLYKGKGYDKYADKVLRYDDRELILQTTSGNLKIFVGKK